MLKKIHTLFFQDLSTRLFWELLLLLLSGDQRADKQPRQPGTEGRRQLLLLPGILFILQS